MRLILVKLKASDVLISTARNLFWVCGFPDNFTKLKRLDSEYLTCLSTVAGR